MLSGLSFSLAFLYGIKSLILCGFHLASFHLAEASVFAFSLLHTLVCAVVNVSKLWNNNRTVHVNKIKTKTKPSTSNSNWSPVLFSAQTMQRYRHSLKSAPETQDPETWDPETRDPETWDPESKTLGPGNLWLWDPGTQNHDIQDPGTGTLGYGPLTTRILRAGPWELSLWHRLLVS